MGLQIEISLGKDLKQLDTFLTDLKFKVITRGVRQGLNRAAKRGRTETRKTVRKSIYNLKLKQLAREINTTPARQRVLPDLESSIDISFNKISLRRFLTPAQLNRSQKGIKVKKRKRLRVRISPGRTSTLKKAFIAKGRNNNIQVFRRRTKKSLPIVVQKVPSIAKQLDKKPSVFKSLLARIQAIQIKEVDRAIAFQLSKL